MVIVPSSKAELRKEPHKILLRSGAAAMVCMLALGGAQYFLRGAKVFPDENLESRLLFVSATNTPPFLLRSRPREQLLHR